MSAKGGKTPTTKMKEVKSMAKKLELLFCYAFLYASVVSLLSLMKAMTKQIPKHLSKRSPRYPPYFSGKAERIFSRVQTGGKHGKAILPSRKPNISLTMSFPHGLKPKRKIFRSWSVLENGQKQKRQKHLSITMKSLNLF